MKRSACSSSKRLESTRNNKTRAAEILGHQPENAAQQVERVWQRDQQRRGGRKADSITALRLGMDQAAVRICNTDRY